jgi:hypothetical protein
MRRGTSVSARALLTLREGKNPFFRRSPLVAESVKERTVRLVYDFFKHSYGPPSSLLKRVLHPPSLQAIRPLFFSSSFRAPIPSPKSAGPPPRRPERQPEPELGQRRGRERERERAWRPRSSRLRCPRVDDEERPCDGATSRTRTGCASS